MLKKGKRKWLIHMVWGKIPENAISLRACCASLGLSPLLPYVNESLSFQAKNAEVYSSMLLISKY